MRKKFKLYQQKQFGKYQHDKRFIFFDEERASQMTKEDINEYYEVVSKRKHNFKSGSSIISILDRIFILYNLEHEKVKHKGYSMSVGDIVYIDEEYYITLDIGFKKLEGVK